MRALLVILLSLSLPTLAKDHVRHKPERTRRHDRHQPVRSSAVFKVLFPPGAGYDSANGDLYTNRGVSVATTRAGTQACNGSTVAINKPCIEGGLLLLPGGVTQTVTTATAAGVSATEGCAKMCLRPSWTGVHPGVTSNVYLALNAAGTFRPFSTPASSANIQIYDGTTFCTLATTYTTSVDRCYIARWSAARTTMRIEDKTSGASSTCAFTAMGASDGTSRIGTLNTTSVWVNVAVGKSWDGCQ